MTGQHRQMVDEILRPFGVEPDVDLGIMRARQTLNEILARVLPRLEERLRGGAPASGDRPGRHDERLRRRRSPPSTGASRWRTSRRGCAASTASTRTRRKRTAACCPASATCTSLPRAYAAENLLHEGVPREEIYVTGNTVVDSLLLALEKRAPGGASRGRAADGPADAASPRGLGARRGRAGRRSSRSSSASPRRPRGTPSSTSCTRSTTTRACASPRGELLGALPNVRLIDPLPYIPFVRLMARASVDPDGLGRHPGGSPDPRDSRARAAPHHRAARRADGGAAADGRSRAENVLGGARPAAGAAAARAGGPPYANPFGDGLASERIRDGMLHFMGAGERPEEFAEPQAAAVAAWPGPALSRRMSKESSS